ncbi:PaaI family thioesterase [Halegenticoccus tardaugens]|uniref:PaaI family thioesterase n=1 Tax=Halegenticoccus tardaugens TaxID=2071624 RepID=UPI00100AF721|nr:hotdog fold thioesterase [Halegenticoccus tardaugens]
MTVEDEYEAIYERASRDPFCTWIGVELVTISEGYAEAILRVRPDHLNFHGTPHGGCVYTVADAAFAAASNSRGERALAMETNMSYLRTVEEGETLRAVADENYCGEKTAEYEVGVFTTADERVATFRGRVYKP